MKMCGTWRRGHAAIEGVRSEKARTRGYEDVRDENMSKPLSRRSRPASLPSAGPDRPPGPGTAACARPVPPSFAPPPCHRGFPSRSIQRCGAATSACPAAGLCSVPGFCNACARGRAGPSGAWGAPEGAGSGALGPRRHHGAAAAARRPQRRRARRLPQGHRPPAAPPPLRPQRDPQHGARLRGDPPLPAVGEWHRGTGGRGGAGRGERPRRECPRGQRGAGRRPGAAPPGGPGAVGAAGQRGAQVVEVPVAGSAPPRGSFCRRGRGAGGERGRRGASGAAWQRGARRAADRSPPAERGQRRPPQRSRPRGVAGTDPGMDLLSECLVRLLVLLFRICFYTHLENIPLLPVIYK